MPISNAEDAIRQPTPDDLAVEQLIADMREAVSQSPEIYRPGAFWDGLVDANLHMLRAEGIDNFKRTVSNNYYNWVVSSLRDPQFHVAVKRWLRRPTLTPWRVRLGDVSRLHTLNSDGAFELSRGAAWRYRFFLGSAWDQARRDDAFELTRTLSEPEVGNPIPARLGSRLISQDLANSIVECSFAGRSGAVRDGISVAELGAGSGRLAHVYASAFSLTYCIFDIPPALAVAQWYLTKVLGAERVVPFQRHDDFSQIEQQLGKGKVAFFTPDQLELFPAGWFDLSQTISTLPEMPREQAEHFVGLLAAKTSKAIFFKQWLSWRNDADNSEFSEADYALPAPWYLEHRRVDPIQPSFFNQVWSRRR